MERAARAPAIWPKSTLARFVETFVYCVDPIENKAVGDVAGRKAALDFNFVKIFDVVGRVAEESGRDITAGVRQCLTPRVVHVQQQSARHPLFQGGLPRVVVRLL